MTGPRTLFDDFVLRTARIAVFAVIFGLIARHFVVRPVTISSGSDQICFVDRMSYHLREPRPGEPMIYRVDSGTRVSGRAVTRMGVAPFRLVGGDISTDIGEIADLGRFEKPEALQSALWAPVELSSGPHPVDSFFWKAIDPAHGIELSSKDLEDVDRDPLDAMLADWEFTALGESNVELELALPKRSELRDYRVCFRVNLVAGAGSIDIVDHGEMAAGGRRSVRAARLSVGQEVPVRYHDGSLLPSGAHRFRKIGKPIGLTRKNSGSGGTAIEWRRVDQRIEVWVDGERALVTSEFPTSRTEETPEPKLSRPTLERPSLAQPSFAVLSDDELDDAQLADANLAGANRLSSGQSAARRSKKKMPPTEPTKRRIVIAITDAAGTLSDFRVDSDRDLVWDARALVPRPMIEQTDAWIVVQDDANFARSAGTGAALPNGDAADTVRPSSDRLPTRLGPVRVEIVTKAQLSGRPFVSLRTRPWSSRWIR